MWGCRESDDVRHYAICPTIWKLAHRRLRMGVPTSVWDRRLHFLGIRRKYGGKDTREAFLATLLPYCTYKAHCG